MFIVANIKSILSSLFILNKEIAATINIIIETGPLMDIINAEVLPKKMESKSNKAKSPVTFMIIFSLKLIFHELDFNCSNIFLVILFILFLIQSLVA